MRTSHSLLLLLAAPPSLFTVLVTAQGNNNNNVEGWNDNYKLDYTYDATSDKGPENWDQARPTQEEEWGEWEVVRDTSGENGDDEDLIQFVNNECGREQRPSPIELIPSATCTDTQELLVRQFDPQLDCQHPLEGNQPDEDATDEWELTPYSLKYYMPRTDRNCRPPTVRLDNVFANVDRRNVPEHFVLLWLEVHARSEHVVQGKRYDAEIQMVHRSTTRPNELVVVSVLVDASGSGTEDHSDFQRYLLDGWQRKHQEEEQTCKRRSLLERKDRHLRGDLRNIPGYAAALQDFTQHSFNVTQFYGTNDDIPSRKKRDLQKCTSDAYGNGCADMGPRRRVFPYNLWPSAWYFSYEGSLTAPPCAGQVHWRIMDIPL